MATRSRIAIENENGSVTSIYCHYDGYPEHNGVILLEHYQTREKVQKLIDLGALSILAPEVDIPEGDGHTFENQTNGIVVAYHRDRGEEFNQATHKSVEQFFKDDIEEYGYCFTKEGEWLIKSAYKNGFSGIKPLGEIMRRF